MPDTVTCTTCKGKGYYEALVSQHDNKTETVTCGNCGGKGVIHQMTQEEEDDFMYDWW